MLGILHRSKYMVQNHKKVGSTFINIWHLVKQGVGSKHGGVAQRFKEALKNRLGIIGLSDTDTAGN